MQDSYHFNIFFKSQVFSLLKLLLINHIQKCFLNKGFTMWRWKIHCLQFLLAQSCRYSGQRHIQLGFPKINDKTYVSNASGIIRLVGYQCFNQLKIDIQAVYLEMSEIVMCILNSHILFFKYHQPQFLSSYMYYRQIPFYLVTKRIIIKNSYTTK